MFNIKELVDIKIEKVNIEFPASFIMDKIIHSQMRPVIVVDAIDKFHGVITVKSLFENIAVNNVNENMLAADFIKQDIKRIDLGINWDDFINHIKINKFPYIVLNSDGSYYGLVSEQSTLKWLFSKTDNLSKEIDAIIDYSNDWLFIADGEGIALRVKSRYEEDFGIKASEVIGKNVKQLENEGLFHPSVTNLILESKKPQTVMQSQKNGRKLLVSGTPVFNSDGSIFRVIVNVRDITHLNELKNKLEESERLKELYYKEIIELKMNSFSDSEIVCSSSQMANMLKTAKKVASVDSTVMITGETGVGKGLVAKYIHDCSPRKSKPFVVVSCGAIPENLLESELFGYVKGAFTGAHQQGKIGKLELANEGTIFLDEIGELPLNLQVKILQVIQEKVISRVGDTKEIKLDLRFIAATNRDLQQMVAERKFREDLYFRLNVIPLEIPPLRDRVEDIEMLVHHFLEKYKNKYKIDKIIDIEVYDCLRRYHWPGNVRELENLIERMFVITDANLIQKYHLPKHILDTSENAGDLSESYLTLQPLEQAKEKLEKKLFLQAVKQCRSTYEIARLFNINQSTVVRKLKKYDIQLIR